MNTTRRTFLGGLAAASIPSGAAVAAISVHAELASDRVARLGAELAEALDEYAGGKFHAVVQPSKRSETPVAFVSNRRQTADERYAFHLAELKKAAEEIDPRIGSWQITRAEDDSLGCSLVITAFRVTGRYDGDGIYEKGSPNWNGDRTKYKVCLIKECPNGERLFKVESLGGMDRIQLPESRLETFIGRRIA